MGGFPPRGCPAECAGRPAPPNCPSGQYCRLARAALREAGDLRKGFALFASRAPQRPRWWRHRPSRAFPALPHHADSTIFRAKNTLQTAPKRTDFRLSAVFPELPSLAHSPALRAGTEKARRTFAGLSRSFGGYACSEIIGVRLRALLSPSWGRFSAWSRAGRWERRCRRPRWCAGEPGCAG